MSTWWPLLGPLSWYLGAFGYLSYHLRVPYIKSSCRGLTKIPKEQTNLTAICFNPEYFNTSFPSLFFNFAQNGTFPLTCYVNDLISKITHTKLIEYHTTGERDFVQMMFIFNILSISWLWIQGPNIRFRWVWELTTYWDPNAISRG